MTLSGGGDADLPGDFGCDVWRIRREEHFISVSLFFSRAAKRKFEQGPGDLRRELPGFAGRRLDML